MKLRRITPKNKKGAIGIIILFVVLLTILVVGFSGVIILSVVDYVSDEVTPIMKEFGVNTGDEYVEKGMNYTFDATDTIIQAFPWLFGFAYFGALIFSIVFVTFYRDNSHPALMGFYFVLMILLVFAAIIMSNMYQDIYDGDDVIAERMQEQSFMSNMVLFSPFYFTLIAVIAGIYLFSRPGRYEGAGI